MRWEADGQGWPQLHDTQLTGRLVCRGRTVCLPGRCCNSDGVLGPDLVLGAGVREVEVHCCSIVADAYELACLPALSTSASRSARSWWQRQ